MSTGALIFAFDGDICYTNIAIQCARRVKQHLGIPVTLVTDQVKTFAGFDNQILVDTPKHNSRRHWADYQSSTVWKNSNRSSAFDLSPYNRTLLIDADYWIDSSALQPILDSPEPFLAHNTRRYINEPHSKVETFGTLKTPMWWATVCIFSKTEYTKDIFNTWKMIENNYDHYSKLFQFPRKPFRNDFALSLALLLCNAGQQSTSAIPWPLLHLPDDCEPSFEALWQITYKVIKDNNINYKKVFVQNQDLHIMSKKTLERLSEIH